MQMNKFVSGAINTEVMSGKDAYEKYKELEEEYKTIGNSIKATRDRARQTALRNKRKKIREHQNILYPALASAGLVNTLQRDLNLSKQALYTRFRNFRERTSGI